MRNSFINWLVVKAQTDRNIFLITADLGFSVIEPFHHRFPDRFINVGVAEQNMIGISSGLASEGFLPYTYSIGVFPTFRCAEQIRNDIDYHNLPTVICTVGSGVAYGNLGYSHHAIQDISIMRSLPNMVIATPCDPSEVESILDWHYQNPCPLYLRLHKAGEPRVTRESSNSLQPAFLNQVYKFSEKPVDSYIDDACVLVIGFLADHVIDVVHKIMPELPVYSVPLWGHSWRKEFMNSITNFKTIIVVEDHMLDGGFGSYVLETVSLMQKNINVITVSLDDQVIGKVARENTLLQPLMTSLSTAVRNLQ